MVLSNKAKFSLLAIAAITSLLMFNVFQVYAAPGQQKVPTLVVFVHVINDDGGTLIPSDFAVAVTAKDPSPAIFSGSETGTTVTMKNSEYKVTELAVKGYNVSYSPGCSGRINNNEAKTCVVTNDDIAPHLKVIKHVINNNGGIAKASDFTMFICCNNPSPSSFPGSENGTDVEIGIGFYFVNENFNPDYTQSLSPECSGEINLGETKTCTITNDDIPKGNLIVVKHVINDNGGIATASDFTMFVCCNNPSPSAFSGSETGTNVTIDEGFYSISESFRPDYSQSNSPDCSGFIRGGETKTCIITNDDVPPAHLIVVKHVINDNGGIATASDFTMFVCCNNPSPSSFPGSENGIDVTIGPGFYSVNEAFNPQYSMFSSFDCSGFINPGETRTCTITNDDVPPSQGGLQAAGPISQVHGFPEWYQDNTGLALQPCLGLNPDGTGLADPNCLVLPDVTFNPALAVSFPNNFPTEFFYYIAEADTPNIGPAQVRMAFRYALEGSFATGAPLVNDQIVFLRIDLRISQVGGTNGLVPDSVYTVTHPFGIITCNTDALGDITTCTDANGNGGGGFQAYRVEDGAFTPPLTPITAASFLAAPTTGLGPFLKAVSPAPPAGYIGNPAIPQTIQPGPNGAALRIAGPGIDPLNVDGDGNANLLVVNNWFVAGKIAVIDTIPPVIGATSPTAVTVGEVNIPATVNVTDDQFVGSVTMDIGPLGNDFTSIINGSNAGTPSAATGVGTFVIDTTANTLSFDISINTAALSSAETAAHIHVPLQAAFDLPLGASKVGVWNYPEALEQDILSGNAFVQIHTTLFPAGEIAGKILLAPTVVNMVPITVDPVTKSGTWGIVIPSATRAGTFNLPITASDGSNTASGVMTLSVV